VIFKLRLINIRKKSIGQISGHKKSPEEGRFF
jgi:hypothetical protein